MFDCLIISELNFSGARESANTGRKELPANSKNAFTTYSTEPDFNLKKTTKYTCPHTLPTELTHVAARSGGPAVVNPKVSTGLRTASSMEAAANKCCCQSCELGFSLPPCEADESSAPVTSSLGTAWSAVSDERRTHDLARLDVE